MELPGGFNDTKALFQFGMLKDALHYITHEPHWGVAMETTPSTAVKSELSIENSASTSPTETKQELRAASGNQTSMILIGPTALTKQRNAAL